LIKELTFENFKGIKSGKIDGLAEVNVFIGRNNSGKSTILEALCFNKAAFEPADALNHSVLENLLQRRVRRQVTSFDEFFYRYNIGDSIISNVLFESGRMVSIKSVFYGGNIRFELITQTNKKIASILVGHGVEASISDVEWIHARTSESARHPCNYIMEKITQLPETSELRRYFSEHEKEIEFINKIALIDAYFVSNIEEIETVFWDSIRRKRLDKEIVAMLNSLYEAKMEDLALIPYPSPIRYEDRGERRSLHKLTTATQNISLNLDGYGEGLRDAFSILIIASQLDNTAILIEEPEAHQHPEALNRLFYHLIKIAKKNKLQLFISTHSLEVVRALASFSNEYAIKVFHTDLDLDGNLKVRTMTAPDLKLMMDLGIDIRFLGKLIPYLILEGKEDKAFLNALSQKLLNQSLEKLPYETLLIPKQEQKRSLKTLVSTGKPINVLTDYDEKTDINDIVRDFASSLENEYEVEVRENHVTVKATGSYVSIIGVGLPEDPDLTSIGINNYAMEDYLVKLLSIDPNVSRWAGITIEELRKRADKLRYEKSLNKSKTILATLGVIKDASEETLINEIVEKSSKEVLTDLLKPLVEEVFSIE